MKICTGVDLGDVIIDVMFKFGKFQGFWYHVGSKSVFWSINPLYKSINLMYKCRFSLICQCSCSTWSSIATTLPQEEWTVLLVARLARCRPILVRHQRACAIYCLFSTCSVLFMVARPSLHGTLYSQNCTTPRVEMSRYIRSTSKEWRPFWIGISILQNSPYIFLTSNLILPGRRHSHRRPPAVGWSTCQSLCRCFFRLTLRRQTLSTNTADIRGQCSLGGTLKRGVKSAWVS